MDDLPLVEAAESDWPAWRGIHGDNRATGPAPPVEFGPDKNVLWKTNVPGRGHASPALWGDHVFLTTAEDADKSMSLLCYDRRAGQQQFKTTIHQGGWMHTHHKNSHASASPICDGERVFATFMVQDGIWVTAVDMEGKIAWQKKVGHFASVHGYGSTPVLHKSLVIVAGDGQGPGYLTALRRDTGDVAWQQPRTNGASFGTPIIATLAGRTQLLLSGHNQVVSHNPDTGEVLWTCRGPADTTANTIAWWNDLVYASGGYPQAGALAIRADGSGDVTKTHVAWSKNFKAYVPSPLVVGDRVLFVRDEGVAVCLAADSGEELWTKRLGGDFSASPTLVGDTVYVPSEAGRVLVLKVAPEYELLADNDLGEGIFASPVIAQGQLFLRTLGRLYCFGAPAE